MEISLLEIMAITGPITALVLFGFFVTAIGHFPKSGIEGLRHFLFYFAMPCALFTSILRLDIRDIFNPTYFIAYGLATGIVLLFTVFVFARGFKRTGADVIINAIGTMTANVLMIGFPIFLSLFGAEGVLGIVLLVLIQDVVFVPVIFFLSDMATSGEASIIASIKAALRKIIRNPIVIGVFSGVIVGLSGIQIPDPIMKPFALLTNSVAGVGLFLIGAMLYGVRIKGLAAPVLFITCTKLILHPALVLITFSFFPSLPDQIKVMGIIVAALPMIGTYTIHASRYIDPAEAAAASLLTTGISFLTLTGWIWVVLN